jgi:tetratricopeptide (TPR) repeat protein
MNGMKYLSLILVLGLVFATPLGSAPIEAYRSYVTGLLAVRQGDIRTALQEYQKVMALDNDATAVCRDLAYIYWQLGMTAEALSAAEKLGLTYSDNLSTQLFLGNFYLIAGQSDSARKAWEKALTIDPDNETAMLYLAAYHSSDNAPEKAIAYWERYLKEEPGSAEAHYQMGLMFDKTGKSEEAKAAFQKAVALKPELGEAHIALGQAYEKDDKPSDAADEYERYLKIVPDNSAVLFYLGGLYYKVKNYVAAENVFLRARALNPKDGNALFWLGMVGEQQKDWRKAARYLEEIRLQEETPLVLTRLSYYYSAQKDYGRALKYLKKASRLDAQNPMAHYLLGLAYMDAGKLRPAEKSLLHALKLKPDMEEANFHLAILHDQQGKFEEAVREMEKIIKLNPRHTSALNYLGYSFAERGIRLPEAEAYIKRVIEIEPDNGSFIDSMAWVHFKMGRVADAEQELQRALTKLPDPVIREHLGDVRIALNRPADAWDAYQKAREADPSSKKLAKKIRDMGKLVLPGTLQRKLLKRAAGNLLQVRSLRLNFAAQGRSNDINFRFLGIFQYLRPELWRVDILGGFMAPRVVVIRNAGLQVYPLALRENLSPQSIELFEQVKDLLNTRLLDAFDSEWVATRSKGHCLLYSVGNATLMIDKDNATVREYEVKDRFILKFRSHVHEEGLDLPAEIDVYSGADKITTNIKLRNFILNENIDQNVFTLDR